MRMYIQCEEIKVCMYNIYSTDQSACILTTSCFSRSNGFMIILFQNTPEKFKIKQFQKAQNYSRLI